MVIALVALAALFVVGIKYLPLIQQNEQMRRRIDLLETELDKQKLQSKQLQAEFDALHSDPKTVERLAREKLGYAKTDETVVHFENATNPPGH